MRALMQFWQMVPDWMIGGLALMPLLLIFLPWTLAQIRMRRRKCKRPEPKMGFWSALVLSTFLFLALAVFGTLVGWSSAGDLSAYAPPGMKEDRFQAFIVFIVNLPVSLLTGIAHRNMRWEKLEALHEARAENSGPASG
jgi:hypothetical protein